MNVHVIVVVYFISFLNTRLVTVPDELLVADLDWCVEGHRLVLDVAVLDVVLVAVLLLLRLVVRHVRHVALLVVAVVAFDLDRGKTVLNQL